MLRRALLFLLLSAFSLPAGAFFHGGGSVAPPTSITIVNFNGQSTVNDFDQISHYDTSNNRLDVHDGMDFQAGGTFYKYGTAYGCGFVWHAASPFCGFQVSTSTDLINWTPATQLFDATTTFWQNNCAGTAGGGGCFRWHMIYNAANNNYVGWFNQGVSTTASAGTDNYFVFVCTTPTTGCVLQAAPVGLSHPTGNGDFALAVDGSGNAYIVYSNWSGGYHNYVQALNASYTDTTGATVDSGAIGEGTSAFFIGSTLYIVYGDLGCGYCTTSATYYVSASTPLGTYGSATTLNSNSCAGQPRSTDVIVAGGHTTVLYSSDQWLNGAPNEGQANIYYHALTFTGAAINPFSCATSTTVAGLTQGTTPPPSPVPAVTSVALDKYYDDALTDQVWRMQTFVSTATTLDHVIMPLGQSCRSGACSVAGLGGNLTVSLVTLNGSNNPLATLATITLTSAQLSWSQKAISLPFHAAGLTIGTSYGLVVGVTGTQNGGSVALEDGVTSTYPAGIQRFSSNAGSTWATEANRALMFSVYP